MAETNARIMEMVRREIQKNPSVSSEELFEKAKKVDRGIGDLNVRQFHARYPLQVKRAAANARKARSGGRAAKKTRTAGTGAGGGAAKKGARRGRPPGTKTGARRGRPPGTKTGARRGRPPGTKTGARRGRPPGAKTGARQSSGAAGETNTTAGAAPAKRRGRPPRAAAPTNGGNGPNRDRIRSLLLQFARDIAGAEGKADVVDVIGNVDRWVEQVVSAAR
jgi:hypothetical protein